MESRKGLMKAIGPGFLFAAVSVGVSHLVQSTRAGAGWGFSLMIFIILAMLLKYPLFEFGQRYAIATGTSLLEGYRRQGLWSLILYLILTLGTMFTVLGAVTAVTAGLAVQLTGWSLPINIWSAILIIIGALILIIGRFPVLDKLIKVIMVILAISTVAAMISVLPRLAGMKLWGPVGLTDVAFIVGLVGWMPTGMDVSVWQSFWALARIKETGHKPSLKQTLFDFNLGYIGTGILALMFCTLGAAVMYNSGIEIESNSGKFAGQIINLYTASLGPWSRPIIVISAFTTMFSTLITVMDGFPRALQLLGYRFRGPEDPGKGLEKTDKGWEYWAWIVAISVGAMLIIIFFLKKLTGLVDLATTLSFITGPFLGLLTYRSIMASWVPDEYKPKPWLRVLALIGIIFLFGFLIFYGYTQIFMKG
jgi:Mn2+/Fe2+ NRAMP family transporter